jgi:hypothetical protein
MICKLSSVVAFVISTHYPTATTPPNSQTNEPIEYIERRAFPLRKCTHLNDTDSALLSVPISAFPSFVPSTCLVPASGHPSRPPPSRNAAPRPSPVFYARAVLGSHVVVGSPIRLIGARRLRGSLPLATCPRSCQKDRVRGFSSLGRKAVSCQARSPLYALVSLDARRTILGHTADAARW